MSAPSLSLAMVPSTLLSHLWLVTLRCSWTSTTPFQTTLIFSNVEFADAVSPLKSHLADFRQILTYREGCRNDWCSADVWPPTSTKTHPSVCDVCRSEFRLNSNRFLKEIPTPGPPRCPPSSLPGMLAQQDITVELSCGALNCNSRRLLK